VNKHATYQQLRAHLAYLKLTAGAEQFPAALEHAEKTKPATRSSYGIGTAGASGTMHSWVPWPQHSLVPVSAH
jgi:hypothetical protein